MGQMDRDYMYEKKIYKKRWLFSMKSKQLLVYFLAGVLILSMNKESLISKINNIFSGKQVAYPDSGTPTYYFTYLYTALPKQTITINADSEDVSKNYFLTIEDWNSHQMAATMFLMGGRQGIFELPSGQYRLIISQGEKWYGNQKLFGNNTMTTEGLEPIEIYKKNHTQVNKVINLQGHFNGNFPVKVINR